MIELVLNQLGPAGRQQIHDRQGLQDRAAPTKIKSRPHVGRVGSAGLPKVAGLTDSLPQRVGLLRQLGRVDVGRAGQQLDSVSAGQPADEHTEDIIVERDRDAA
jgi:hypothetical protein